MDAEPNLTRLVFDEVRRDLVITNLVFTRCVAPLLGQGLQTIAVVARSQQGAAHISIEDQGPGVRVEDRERVWEPFYRAADHAESTGGTGIGLAMSAALTASLGVPATNSALP